MIFLLLAAIGLIYGVLGFLLHAFYVSKAGLARRLETKLEASRKEIEHKEREAEEAREQITAADSRIRTLNQQLQDRGKDLEALRRTIQRQQQEIEILRQTAVKGNDHQQTPLWKDNLNNLLNMLERIETDE